MAQKLTYKKAGVDIAKANGFVAAVKQMASVDAEPRALLTARVHLGLCLI